MVKYYNASKNRKYYFWKIYFTGHTCRKTSTCSILIAPNDGRCTGVTNIANLCLTGLHSINHIVPLGVLLAVTLYEPLE